MKSKEEIIKSLLLFSKENKKENKTKNYKRIK